ncbi:MAG: hypothetical protein EHM23_31210, partial [Acidobacteria bacterium]
MRRISRSFQLVWISFMASGLSRGDSDQQVVPFNLVGHMIIVKGSIGDQNDLTMMVDTGATRTLIS